MQLTAHVFLFFVFLCFFVSLFLCFFVSVYFCCWVLVVSVRVPSGKVKIDFREGPTKKKEESLKLSVMMGHSKQSTATLTWIRQVDVTHV